MTTIYSFVDEARRCGWSLSPAGLDEACPAVIDVGDYEYTDSIDQKVIKFYSRIDDAIRRLVTT